ncbi:hypothetical protein [Mycobacterium sp. 050134]|uniref:hypothetical protein n=1 Tax=Mycobacterium sp. 050134 TaxID=3096111 RepID=UPI002ED78FC6
MSDQLIVDPPRLKDAGSDLRAHVLPAAPPPIAATGADPVAAAINATMPVIETPVLDGLRDIKVALRQTGSKFAAAAGIYADADQSISDRLIGVEFFAASDGDAYRADRNILPRSDRPAGGESLVDETRKSPGTPDLLSTLGPNVPKLGDAANATQTASTFAQSLVQGFQGAAPTSTPAASGGMKNDEPSADQAATEEEDRDSERAAAAEERAAGRLASVISNPNGGSDKLFHSLPS